MLVKFLTKFAQSICISSIILLAACANYQPAQYALHEATIQPYRLDSGDRLRITVFEQANLTGNFGVDQAGYISFPLVGAIAARGKTAQELEGSVARALKKGFLRNPDVTIEIASYRPFFILGEVKQPGQYSYQPGINIQNAVAIAGGFTIRAEKNSADITRKINGEVMTGRVLITDPILAGDTIYVRERFF